MFFGSFFLFSVGLSEYHIIIVGLTIYSCPADRFEKCKYATCSMSATRRLLVFSCDLSRILRYTDWTCFHFAKSLGQCFSPFSRLRPLVFSSHRKCSTETRLFAISILRNNRTQFLCLPIKLLSEKSSHFAFFALSWMKCKFRHVKEIS